MNVDILHLEADITGQTRLAMLSGAPIFQLSQNQTAELAIIKN